jgi:hypothetical protein
MFSYLILFFFCFSRLAILMGEGSDGQPTDGSPSTVALLKEHQERRERHRRSWSQGKWKKTENLNLCVCEPVLYESENLCHVSKGTCVIWTFASLLMGLMNPLPFKKKVVFVNWEHNMPFLLSHWFSQLEIFHLIHVNRSCNLPLVLVIHTLKISLDLKVEKLELGQTWDTPLTECWHFFLHN